MRIDVEGERVQGLSGVTNTLKQLRLTIVEIHRDSYDNYDTPT
jgi:hypothetical protein